MRFLNVSALKLTTVSLVLALCAACATKVAPEHKSEFDFYQKAQEYLDHDNFGKAIHELQELESRFPFGRYAEQAQVELIYAYYRNLEADAAKASAERFIRLHPQHPSVDYAYYMKGLTAFYRDKGLFERFLPTDMTQRDPGAARDSFNDFSQLLSRFPNSIYAPDAKARMLYLRNLLARYEIHAADYYMRRGAYVAAGNRGRYVVENFQQTPAVPDALAIMVESYNELELHELAESTLQVLAKNHPDYEGFTEDGSFTFKYEQINKPKTWTNIVSFGLLD